MVLIDSNIILRLFLNDVPKQRKFAQEYIEKVKEEVMINDACLAEVIYVLEKSYGKSRIEIIDGLEFLRHSKFELEGGFVTYTALSIYPLHPQLSFPDCILLARKVFIQDEVLTFDKNLNKGISEMKDFLYLHRQG